MHRTPLLLISCPDSRRNLIEERLLWLRQLSAVKTVQPLEACNVCCEVISAEGCKGIHGLNLQRLPSAITDDHATDINSPVPIRKPNELLCRVKLAVHESDFVGKVARLVPDFVLGAAQEQQLHAQTLSLKVS